MEEKNMSEQEKIFERERVRIINLGYDRELWDLCNYSVRVQDYELWNGWLQNPNAKLSDLPESVKLVIELNLLFEGVAKVSNSGYIETKNHNSEQLVDWLLYNDEYGIRRNIELVNIIIFGDKHTDCDSYDSVYEAIVLDKIASQNVFNTRTKLAIKLLKDAYMKKRIEILAYHKDTGLFKIVITKDGLIDMPHRYIKEVLVPGAIPHEAKVKIQELKEKM